MKKLLFGCTLMLTGIVGGSSWLIAESNLIQPGAWSSMLSLFNFKNMASVIIILFYVLAVAGGIIAIKALKEDK